MTWPVIKYDLIIISQTLQLLLFQAHLPIIIHFYDLLWQKLRFGRKDWISRIPVERGIAREESVEGRKGKGR
jgi:hypothetical protein